MHVASRQKLTNFSVAVFTDLRKLLNSSLTSSIELLDMRPHFVQTGSFGNFSDGLYTYGTVRLTAAPKVIHRNKERNFMATVLCIPTVEQTEVLVLL